MTDKEIAQVLSLIRPGAEWNIRGGKIEWLDKVQAQPTDAEMAAGSQQLLNLAYRDKRSAEYPPVGDQLDALWTGGQAAADMLVKIQAVKAKYPKGA